VDDGKSVRENGVRLMFELFLAGTEEYDEDEVEV
jgi:hypothetical protein